MLKFLLNLEFDASGAFRVIDSKKIKLKDILLSNQNGYSYFWESLYLLKKKKYKISEISIQLPYRKLGSSKMKIKDISSIYVNRGPGSFAGVRNSLSVIKAFHLAMKIDYYCFSFRDFKDINEIKYENIPILCDKFKIKKNLINPIYIS